MNLTKKQKVHAEIIQRAWEDEDFKRQLTADPVNTLEEFSGLNVSIPAGKRMVVRDFTNGQTHEGTEDESVFYFDIPSVPNVDDLELTEEELEQVAGGFTIIISACALITLGKLIGDCFDDK